LLLNYPQKNVCTVLFDGEDCRLLNPIVQFIQEKPNFHLKVLFELTISFQEVKRLMKHPALNNIKAPEAGTVE